MRTTKSKRAVLGALAIATLAALAACAARDATPVAAGERYDVVIRGGRVIDPESGLDAVRDVGLRGGRIAAVSESALEGARVLEARGLVVAPGFIDLHSHALTTPSMRMQAFDGVTTALELELGSLPIDAAYDTLAREGRPINYGFSVSWAIARMKVLDGVVPNGRTDTYSVNFGKPRWKERVSRERTRAVIAEVERGLRDGGVGIGILAGYAPESNREEYLALARLAARYRVPTFTHVRATNQEEPGSSYEGVAELVAAAAGTGAHMHLCHLNSSTWRHVGHITDFIAQAQRRGVRVTTEAYPYGASSTTIGAPRYAPENLPLAGMRSTDIYVVDAGRWITGDDDLARVRAATPQSIAVFHFLNEEHEADRALLGQALLFPGAAIASDAIPYTVRGRPVEGDVWPLPAGADAHPRVAGTFTRVLARWVRDRGALTLPDAIRRATLVPAQILEDAVPAMKAKGRIRPGADADIVVFDAATVGDRATYQDPRQHSVGMRYVLVAGVPVIDGGELVRSAMPGRPVRGPAR